MAKAIAAAPVKERFLKLGFEARGSAPAEFAAFIKDEVASYARVAQAAGVKPE
jgi:tripartite-type tricarboxylate transporter receptor subunit TctC